MTPSVDPVATGIVKSLDHPGGIITSITEMMPELTPQRLNLLKQIVPTLSRVAILWRPSTLSEDGFKHMLQETQATARSLGVHIQVVEVAQADDFLLSHDVRDFRGTPRDYRPPSAESPRDYSAA
jgi:putative ABC transport system substrate-binding protein